MRSGSCIVCIARRFVTEAPEARVLWWQPTTGEHPPHALLQHFVHTLQHPARGACPSSERYIIHRSRFGHICVGVRRSCPVLDSGTVRLCAAAVAFVRERCTFDIQNVGKGPLIALLKGGCIIP